MLREVFPNNYNRYGSLPVLGPHLDAFAVWLHEQGYPLYPIKNRIRATECLAQKLRRDGVRRPSDLTATELLDYIPSKAKDIYLAAVIRSLVRYFDAQGILASKQVTPTQKLLASYGSYLEGVRGLSKSTISYRHATACELLDMVGYDEDTNRIRHLNHRDVEAFLEVLGGRLCRASLQHAVSNIRCFLHFLVTDNWVPGDFSIHIDTPRIYRDEQLPRSVPWELVRKLLSSIDRSTPMGRRDYAMLLLIATYGLRVSEVASLTLDDVEWRAGYLRLIRPKSDGRLMLPLTDEAGNALVDYIRSGRPSLCHREIFLRLTAPAGALSRSAVAKVFRRCVQRSELPIPFQGPHCLRHSVAVHLLRQGTSMKAISDLLGHRSVESTAVYLRLDIEDLREVALDLPTTNVRRGKNQ